MLRTNLATRPFYNERLVHVALGAFAIVLIALSVFNVSRAISLTREQASFAARAARDEARVSDLQRNAAQIRARLDAAELAELERASIEANGILDRRAFSWTELFNRIEATIPDGVMLTAIAPNIDAGTVSFNVVGRRVEDIDGFMEALEASGAFRALLLSEERATDDGMYQANLRGEYQLGAGEPPDAPRSTAVAENAATSVARR